MRDFDWDDFIAGALNVIGVLMVIVAIGFLALFGVFMFDRFNDSKSHRYWIYNGRNTDYTNSYKVNGDCIYYVNEYKQNIERCGSYTIEDRNKKVE